MSTLKKFRVTLNRNCCDEAYFEANNLEDAENKINDEEFFNTLNFKEYIGEVIDVNIEEIDSKD